MSRKGFTLIELLVVIAIMGILSTLAMVNFSTYLDNKKLDTEAYKLHSFISNYKVKAYKTEAVYYFRIANGGTAVDFNTLEVCEKDETGALKVIGKYSTQEKLDGGMETLEVGISIDGTINTSDNVIASVNPLSLGYQIESDSLVMNITHSSLEGIVYAITFYNEQARVKFQKNDKEL